MAAAQPVIADLPPTAAERRSGEDRYVSIFRAGKLTRGDGAEELCVLRNISAGGAMLAHDGDVRVDEPVMLDLRLDEQLSATVVWVSGDRCGLRFDTPADLARILAGHGDGQRPRPPRVRLAVAVGLQVGEARHRALLRDISQTGACLAIDEFALPRVPELRVVLDGLGDFRAGVRWRRSGLIGVNFASTLTMWDLNGWIRAQR